MKILKFLILFLLCVNSLSGLLDTSHLLKRRKRTLIFQEGLNWVQMVVGIGLPLEVADNSITMGAAVKSYYECPNNATVFTNPSSLIEINRKKRSAHLDRFQIYKILEKFLTSNGYGDAKSCLLNWICQCARWRFDKSSGLLAELLHLLLTPSTSQDNVRNPFDRDFHAAELTGRTMIETSCSKLYPCLDAGNFLRKFTQYL